MDLHYRKIVFSHTFCQITSCILLLLFTPCSKSYWKIFQKNSSQNHWISSTQKEKDFIKTRNQNSNTDDASLSLPRKMMLSKRGSNVFLRLLNQMQFKIKSLNYRWTTLSQCENFMILLSFRFYVKSIIGILKMQNLPF